VAGCQML